MGIYILIFMFREPIVCVQLASYPTSYFFFRFVLFNSKRKKKLSRYLIKYQAHCRHCPGEQQRFEREPTALAKV